MNNFGIGSPGVTTFHIPKGPLSNTSHLNAAVITKFRCMKEMLYEVRCLKSNEDMIPLSHLNFSGS